MINPVFAATMLVGLALPMLPTKTNSAERRLYWAGSLVATISAFFVLYPPDWGGGLVLAGALGAGLVVRAYMTRSYIRIRGRTYAFNLSDSRSGDAQSAGGGSDRDAAPDSYAGFATATKTWWLFAFVMTGCAFICAIYVTEREGPWYALGAGAVIALVAVLAGNQDASWGYQIARGRWVPFAVAGVATLGTFTALYILAYAMGKRWPLRPKGSMEYREHPHLRDRYG